MTHEFDFGNRAPSWEQHVPRAWRTGNVIKVDFSQVAARRPSLSYFYDAAGYLHSTARRPRYDDFDLPF